MESNIGTMVKLTATNYSLWKSMMEDRLNLLDLYDPIEGDGSKPEKMSDGDWKKLKKKTLSTIRQWVDITLYNQVSKETDPQVLWKKLESMYETKNAQSKIFMMRKLMNLKLQEGRAVAEHLNDFEGLVMQLISAGLTLEDEMQALLLLGSLPDSWDTLVVSLSNSAPEGKVSLNMVRNSILNEEIRRRDVAKNETHALVTERRSRSKSRTPRGHRDHSKSRERRSCYNCGKPGHLKKNCRFLKKEIQDKNQANDRNTAATTSASDDEITLLCNQGECCHIAEPDEEWIIDSAASYHCVPKREYFTTYRKGDFGHVNMGNKSTSQIVGIGDIHLQTGVGCTLILKDVRHIPDIRLNLISVNVLDKEGYEHSMKGGRWKLTKGSLVVAKGKLCCTLYKTYVKVCKGQLNAVENDASPNLWHRRLAHISEKGLQLLAKQSLIPQAKGDFLNPCDYCVFGKHHRVSFKKSSNRKKNKLELVHSDVCGPMEVESLGGNKYFVTFIDDASRKTWVYLLQAKSQVFQCFQQFHAMVERETGKQLKCIRTDNGGEYISKEFKDYCSKYGIRHEKTVPGTPQHNGIAERMNRTIVEKVRCMLRMAKLPKPFWGEAVQTAVYLINRLPSVPLGFDIPERVWAGKEVSYSHLKVFGCKAFMHVPKEQRSKLDDKAIPCVFVGYGNEEFGYKLWDPERKRIVRSRDVIFHEHETIEDLKGGEAAKPMEDGVNPTSHVPSECATDGRQTQEPEHETEEPVFGDEESVDEEVVVPDTEANEQGEPSYTSGQVEPQIRRSTRERQPSTKYPSSEYILIADEGEPESFQEVQSHKDKGCWVKAMQEEMDSLKRNNTYELVQLPKGRRVLKNKWVFKLKKDGDKLVRHKARLVVKGFSQKQGIDFEEIFSPVVKMCSIRVILGLVASMDLELEQLDVKTAFLHGDLDEEIYMEQPEGFEVKGKEDMVCKLKKSLYGLKQAPRQWYKKFDSFIKSQGFKRTDADPCVYINRYPNGKFLILLLYVDDMLIVGQDVQMIKNLKVELSKAFDMKDMGAAKHILGMDIIRDRKAGKLWLSQERYIERVLERFNMKNAKPVITPLVGHFKLSKKSCPTIREKMSTIPYSSAVGSLMYAMVCTRPDIAHAVGVVSRYLSNPGKTHWEAVKWILRYLRGTSKLCLRFGGAKPILEGYTDADMAGDLDDRKSTSGYIFTFSGGAISWQSKLQKCISLSTTEAEYVAATEAGKEMLWMKKFLQELGLKQEEYIVYCDSQSALDLSKNTMYHSRTKHIDVRYHWIRLAIEKQLFQLKKIHTDRNAADMLTKNVTREKLRQCIELVGMTV
uniref:Retrovirus-related Pol polyprotein from transposon TNT 1-94 n=1 Tax=Cajanus cajan TaxID=3821 RepID=A0A151THM1_CAJCA|nr:Retrovirus-related Pol polyprotein from transposon TNT 1-94 [Cajanus cajan]